MENLLWILPLLICALGMLLMGAVVWVGAKLGLRSPEPDQDPSAQRGMRSHTVLPGQRPEGLGQA
jgi:hypothetical protein